MASPLTLKSMSSMNSPGLQTTCRRPSDAANRRAPPRRGVIMPCVFASIGTLGGTAVIAGDLAGVGATGLVIEPYFAEPLAVAKAFWNLSVSGEIFIHAKTSLWRAVSGFVIGGLGLLLGLLTGTFRTAETLLDTSLQMIRTSRRWR
jgi:ABC-type nitrate/sulfonate/bicarbonate transport system permease component